VRGVEENAPPALPRRSPLRGAATDGPLELWHGRDEDLETYDGLDPADTRGKENLDFSDLGLRAEIRPEGLLAGLGAFSVIAGAGFEAVC